MKQRRWGRGRHSSLDHLAAAGAVIAAARAIDEAWLNGDLYVRTEDAPIAFSVRELHRLHGILHRGLEAYDCATIRDDEVNAGMAS